MEPLGKILIVDDSTQLRMMVDVILSGEGYATLTADSGEKALDILNQDSQIDLVLLDVMMPGMDGFETLKQIRNNSETELVKVIMLTAMTEVEDMARAFELGAEDYVIKPFRSSELKARVNTHMRLKQREEKVRQQEIALRQSEERFRRVSAVTADFAYYIEHQGGNEGQWLWSFGDIKHFIGEDAALTISGVIKLVHPDDVPFLLEHIENIKAGRPHFCNLRLLQPDGTIKWVRSEAFPDPISNPSTPMRYLGVVKDITDLKKTEIDLDEKNRLLQSALKNAPVRIAIVNFETEQIEFSNVDTDQFFLKVSPSQNKNLSFGERFRFNRHPDDKSQNIREQIDVLPDDTTLTVEFEEMGQDNTYHWQRSYVNVFERNADRQVRKIVSVTIDITSQKRMQLELQKSHAELEERVKERTLELEKLNLSLLTEIEERRLTNAILQSILNNNQQAFIVLNAECEFINFNQVLKDLIFRYFHKEVRIGTNIRDILWGKAIEWFDPLFKRALKGEVIQKEINMMSSAGISHWFRVAFTPSLTEDNHLLGITLSMLDISSQKRNEEILEKEHLLLKQKISESTTQLEEINRSLTRANFAKEELLAFLNRDIKLSLNTAIGLADSLMANCAGLLGDSEKQDLETLKDNNQYVLDLMGYVLDMARIDSGRLALELTPVPVEHVCQTSLNAVANLASQKKVTILIHLDPRVTHLMADEARLIQTWIAMLTYSINTSFSGEPVNVNVEGHPENQSMDIIVQNSGEKISEALLSNLGMVEGHLDLVPLTSFSGSVVILNWIQKMVALHQGSLKIKNLDGCGGSQWIVSLPWKEVPSEGKGGQSFAAPDEKYSRLSNVPCILLAEGNEITMAITSEMLKSKGCQVIEVYTGQEAFEKMQGQYVDVVLLDNCLPEVDGMEAVQYLRNKGYGHTPMIVLTPLLKPGDRAHYLSLGANECFPRPKDPGKLFDMLNQWIN